MLLTPTEKRAYGQFMTSLHEHAAPHVATFIKLLETHCGKEAVVDFDSRYCRYLLGEAPEFVLNTSEKLLLRKAFEGQTWLVGRRGFLKLGALVGLGAASVAEGLQKYGHTDKREQNLASQFAPYHDNSRWPYKLNIKDTITQKERAEAEELRDKLRNAQLQSGLASGMAVFGGMTVFAGSMIALTLMYQDRNYKKEKLYTRYWQHLNDELREAHKYVEDIEPPSEKNPPATVTR